MILVTGASGHIGNVLVRKLLARGHGVRALVLPGEDCTSLDGLEVEICPGNVLAADSLTPAFAGVETVYHLAGMISILPGENDLVYRVNVNGTLNVLQAAQQAGVRRLLHTSSIHAFRRIPPGTTIDEQVPFDPEHALSTYDRSKARASLEVVAAARRGLDAVIVCPTGVIGPFDYRGSEMGQLIQTSMQHRAQFCIAGAYDFVDVRDVAEGMILACEQGRCGETYILAGEQITLANLMDTVGQVIGRRTVRLNVPLGLARLAAYFSPLAARLTGKRPLFTSYSIETVVGNSIISAAKARRELGYTARPIRQSIEDSVNWFLEHPDLSVR